MEIQCPLLISFGVALSDVVFGCRPDQGRDTCRNSANASIVSQSLRYQSRFYLRPKFRQLQRLLGPAYNFFGNPTRERGTGGDSMSLAYASGYQNHPNQNLICRSEGFGAR